MNSIEKTSQLCGSSRDLAEEVKAWRIREDFYYLVSAVTLLILPLRSRKPEILTIADDLVTHYSKQFDRPRPILSKEIVGHLMEHTWPGNLMELQTAIKTFVAMGDTGANSKGATAANSTDTPQLRQPKNQIRAQRAGIAAARQEQARLQQKIRTYESRIESSPAIEEEYKQIMRDHETAVQFYNTLLAKMNQSSMANALEHRQQRAQAAFINSRILGFVLNAVKDVPFNSSYSYCYGKQDAGSGISGRKDKGRLG